MISRSLYAGVGFFLLAVAAVLADSNVEAAAKGKPLDIRYKLRNPGKVSVAIYDSQGRIVRELARGVPRKAGRHEELWDTRDNSGKPLPAGDYTWKLLATPGLSIRYVMSFGSNYPIKESDPWWALGGPGTHGGPQAVACDDSGFYVATFTENIEACLIKLSPDGKTRLWSAPCPGPWEGGNAFAVVSNKVYMLGNGRAWIYDAATGAKHANPIDLKWLPEGVEADVRAKKKPEPQGPADIAIGGGILVAAYPGLNTVRWIDLEKGTEIARATVAEPRSVAMASEGAAVYVSSSNAVLKVTRNGESAVLVPDLKQPGRLRLDVQKNELWVVEGGTKQIRRFDLSGKLLGTLGEEGGRRDGLYTPDAQRSFNGVSDVAAWKGDFWVAEALAGPRRVAHFRNDGSLIDEWYGGQVWAPWVAPDPADPNVVWMPTQWGSMMRVILDPEKKTWKIHSVYTFSSLASGLIGGHSNAHIWEARRFNGGKLYLLRQGNAPCVVRVDEEKWKLMPVSVGYLHIQHYRNELTPRLVEWSKGRDAMLWTDANGDGEPQPDEMQWFGDSAGWGGGGEVVDENGNYLHCRDGIREYPLTGWNSAGAPVYSQFPTGQVVAAFPPRFKGGDPRWSIFLNRTAKNELLAALNTEVGGWGQSKDAFFVRYDAKGKELWQVGEKGDQSGQCGVFRRVLGEVHGCAVVNNFSIEWASERFLRTYVWDRDGLWVGGLFDNPDLNGILPPLYAAGGEALAGVVREDPKTGEVLLYAHWLNEGRLFRVTGWDGWQRDSGKLRLKETAPVLKREDDPWAEVSMGTGAGLAATYWKNSAWKGDPALQRVENPDVDFGVGGQKRPAEVAGGGYSAQWTGFIEPRRTGVYWFRIERARGRLEIDGKYVAGDAGDPGSPFAPPAQAVRDNLIRLEAGRRYPVRVQLSDASIHPSVAHGVQLLWQEPGNRDWKVVPQAQLYPEEGTARK